MGFFWYERTHKSPCSIYLLIVKLLGFVCVIIASKDHNQAFTLVVSGTTLAGKNKWE